MGYTRYWNRTDKPITDEFIGFVETVVDECNKNGIRICDGLGEGQPIIESDGIYLNGDASRHLDHESFVITNNETGFNFCKTARKPYDIAVRLILDMAMLDGLVEGVSSDGSNDRMITDDEYCG